MIQTDKTILKFLLISVALLTGALNVCAQGFSDGIRKNFNMPQLKNIGQQDIDMSADSYEYVGSNLIARGHAVVRMKDLQITAKSVVINMLSKDMEATGDVIFSAKVTQYKTVDLAEYEELMRNPAIKVVASGISTDGSGSQKIRVKITMNSSYLKAERVSGSLETGAFQFRNFSIKAGNMFFTGKLAERYPNGTLKLFRSQVTTCEYQVDDNAHYEIYAHEMTLTPREANRSIYNYNPDQGEHSLLAVSNVLQVWNFPVFWFPVLYKPRDSSALGLRFTYGNKSRWGNYIRTLKDFEILHEPAVVRAAVMVDYYEERGFGFGGTADIITKDSKTEFFFYHIHDDDPYMFWDDDRTKPDEGYTKKDWLKRYSRYVLPKNRYELRLSHLSHLTDRLDFRAQIDKLSDYNFLEDYFEQRYEQDMQPPTFAALEYQADRFSAGMQARVRINDFDTSLNRLPELRLDFQRQELFKGIYYQGQTSAGYYEMKWREYDYDRIDAPYINYNQMINDENRADLRPGMNKFLNPIGWTSGNAARYLRMVDPETFNPYFNDPQDYSAFRFDTLHGLYYPFQLFGFLNLNPRALARFTSYSRSSKTKIDIDKLYNMFAVDKLDGWPDGMTKVYNYDDKGGSRYRFVFELGLEGNVKFSRTWQTPKSSLLMIDGLRHVAVPYFNLTYIPEPTTSYEHLYYFDDVDLIDKQAFIRLGLLNKIQTRRNNKIYEWFSMENYWDFHFEKAYGFNHIGDLGTIVKFTPTSNFSITADLLLDIGQNNEHKTEAYRMGEAAGRPGISGNLINRFNISAQYKITKDWKVGFGYNYRDAYAQRNAYSMGSTLTQINALSFFKNYFDRDQSVYGSLDFPSIIDKRLRGRFFISYDVDKNLFDDISLMLYRNFHCWYAAARIGCSSEYEWENRTKEWSWYFNFTVGLTAMPAMSYTASFDGTFNDSSDSSSNE
ncbi:MAG: LPS-assembly protein LptD [Lentisphaeria bacterium]|nr:LPS-assembly protein LptD [Lentisphaeria bacterium]